jgi:hypothetical protein
MYHDPSLPAIGAGATQLIKALPRLLPEVRAFEFSEYPILPSMLEEIEALVKPEVVRGTEFARKLMPLDPKWRVGWLNVNLEPYAEADFEKVISLVLRHRTSNACYPVRSRDVASGIFAPPDGSSGQYGQERVLALTSRCTFADGRPGHIPLLDFRCEPNDYFLRLLTVGLSRLAGSGALLRSGRSFHFYGFRTMDQEEWRRFMAEALLLAPLTDVRYIAHRLLDGFAALRFTTSPHKPTEPTVAAYVDS